MKIHSKFTDYYDYVKYIYSPEGGDNDNIYNRIISGCSYIPGTTITALCDVKAEGTIPDFPQPISGRFKETFKCYRPNQWTYFPWRFKWVFVCGKLHLLVAELNYEVNHRGIGYNTGEEITKFRLLTEDHPCLEHVKSPDYWRTKVWKTGSRPPLYDNKKGLSCPALERVAKEFNLPVFALLDYRSDGYIHGRGVNKYTITLHQQVPNLAQLGFASIISAEQMYQNISMYLNNLRGNPDTVPPAEVSDKDRLTQKGFDAKVSFRGKAAPAL